ncbi:MAG: hypothetical protein JO347_07455 [Candidatus Eremiobacteraeota bacterium]|nr:hypothetical protein [Candidatus Eremiobacteraeota bacterium]
MRKIATLLFLLAIGALAHAPARAASQPANDPGSAVISDPGGSDYSGFMIVVEPNGHAWAVDGAGHASGDLNLALTQSFFADLAGAGPLAQLPAQQCAKALVIGWNGQRSPNLLCSSDARVSRLLGDIDAIQRALYVHSYRTAATLNGGDYSQKVYTRYNSSGSYGSQSPSYGPAYANYGYSAATSSYSVGSQTFSNGNNGLQSAAADGAFGVSGGLSSSSTPGGSFNNGMSGDFSSRFGSGTSNSTSFGSSSLNSSAPGLSASSSFASSTFNGGSSGFSSGSSSFSSNNSSSFGSSGFGSSVSGSGTPVSSYSH